MYQLALEQALEQALEPALKHQSHQEVLEKKRLLCNCCTAETWGVKGAKKCTKSRTKCGFAHGLSDQVETSENHYFNKLVRDGLNGNTDSFSKYSLTDPKWGEKNITFLKAHSKICGRYLSCLHKRNNGTLEFSDICTGGLNCMGGVCSSSPNLDPKESILIDEGDWQTGVPSDSTGRAIRLTQFGLIPHETQLRLEKEREMEAVREKQMAELAMGPSLSEAHGSTDSEVTKSNTPSHNWAKKDWKQVADEAEDLQLLKGEQVIVHNGKTYKYTLQEGQEMKIIHDRPHLVEQMYEPDGRLRHKFKREAVWGPFNWSVKCDDEPKLSNPNGYDKLFNMTSIESEEDKARDAIFAARLPTPPSYYSNTICDEYDSEPESCPDEEEDLYDDDEHLHNYDEDYWSGDEW